jgi:hypothetical protein
MNKKKNNTKGYAKAIIVLGATFILGLSATIYAGVQGSKASKTSTPVSSQTALAEVSEDSTEESTEVLSSVVGSDVSLVGTGASTAGEDSMYCKSCGKISYSNNDTCSTISYTDKAGWSFGNVGSDSLTENEKKAFDYILGEVK